MKRDTKIELAAADRQRLERLVAAPSTPQKHVWRAQIVLLSADGAGTMEIIRQVGVSKRTVWRWQDRYGQQGVEGLRHDKTRPGRLPPLAADTIRAVVEKTLQESPPDGATHWSTRSMARTVGLGRSSIHKIWTQHGLQPHRVKTFKVSRDPAFVDKVRDVVGLYVNPPEHTLVLSVDEKSQIQALERTQAPLPLVPGHAATRTHDYRRHGTTTLFAALDVRTGRVIGQCMMRHRHQEFLRFLAKINRETPAHLAVHLIVDNYQTHKHSAVKRWLALHPRFHMHFTPTSASWLNLVERLFAELTDKHLRRGIFKTVVDLQAAINRFLQQRNRHPKPFVWTKAADTIIRKHQSGYLSLRTGH